MIFVLFKFQNQSSVKNNLINFDFISGLLQNIKEYKIGNLFFEKSDDLNYIRGKFNKDLITCFNHFS